MKDQGRAPGLLCAAPIWQFPFPAHLWFKGICIQKGLTIGEERTALAMLFSAFWFPPPACLWLSRETISISMELTDQLLTWSNAHKVLWPLWPGPNLLGWNSTGNEPVSSDRIELWPLSLDLRAHKHASHAERCPLRFNFCAQTPKLGSFADKAYSQLQRHFSFSPFSFPEATGFLLADTTGAELLPSGEISPIKANKGTTVDDFLGTSPLEIQAPTSLWFHLAVPITQLRE